MSLRRFSLCLAAMSFCNAIFALSLTHPQGPVWVAIEALLVVCVVALMWVLLNAYDQASVRPADPQ